MFGLMGSKRFAPLFWCQFLSAFNDNFVRTLLGMMLLFRVGQEAAEAQMAMAVALFIAFGRAVGTRRPDRRRP